MDGVLPRAPTGRPRIAAVGAVLTLCLVGAPLMSLFPPALWEFSRALTLSDAGMGLFLLTPVVTGVVLLMAWLADRWLAGFGVVHALTCSVLVTGTAMAVPVVVSFLAPDAALLPGGPNVNIAFLTGLITTLGLGSAMLAAWLPGDRSPGALPAVAVVFVLLLLLPALSEVMRGRTAAERAGELIRGYGRPITVLDHPDWTLAAAHRTHRGLRLTYLGGGGAPLYVVTWDSVSEEITQGCDYPGTRCVDGGDTVAVHHSDAAPAELRVAMDDGRIVSLSPGCGAADDLAVAAEHLRPESPGERDLLAEDLSSLPWR
ncbi:hypothetical protein [Nocardiopsis sp. CC223A]|uniref:hypothetical protein n=1 Tax=Nocardiopsis sp. CC223A TaxID=3044051 RepID=UPI00278C1E97|nr:hypothetical protein [Nocardiopsis sp. CC223A]